MPADARCPVGMAVIGCGRISASHLDAIAAQPALGTIVAVTDADPTRAADTAARYGAAHHGADLAAVLALDAVEAVVIATPNDCHAPQTLQALAAGRHVLVEKPMAENAGDAREMAAAAERTGKILAIGHTFRHGAAIRHLQDHRADYGRLRAIEVSQCVFWDGPQAPWWATRPADQGLMLSLFAPHSLDFIQMAMGDDDPLRVHVEAARHQSGWLGEDEAMILLAYPGRRMTSLHLSYNQRQVTDRKTLFFDRGVLRIEDGEYLYWNDDLLVEPAAAIVTDRRSMGGRDLSGYFRTQFAEFVHAVRGELSRVARHEDGRRLIELIDRVRRSARENSADMIDGPFEE